MHVYKVTTYIPSVIINMRAHSCRVRAEMKREEREQELENT